MSATVTYYYTIVNPLLIFSMCSFALIRSAAMEFVRISVDVFVIVILTAFDSLFPFATLSSSPPPSLLHFPPVMLPGDPGLILPSGEDTDIFGGDRIRRVPGGGMDGRLGGVVQGTGVPGVPCDAATDMCCVGGVSLI